MRGCVTGIAVLIALLLGGCSPLRGSPKETIVSSDAIEALAKTFNLSGNIEAYNAPGATEPVKRAARDKLVDCGIALIDARYSEFVKKFTASKKTTDTLAEVGSMGLNTAGALMTPSSTVRILSALAGGVTATNTSYTKNFFYEKSVVVLIRQMNASRRSVLVDLLKGRRSDTSSYSLTDALRDLGRYYEAGTFEGSLDAITQSAAEEAKQADQEIEDIRGNTISWLTWINENGRDAAIALLIQRVEGLPAASKIRKDILATASGAVLTQFPPTAPPAPDDGVAASNRGVLNDIYGTTDQRLHSFTTSPNRLEPYLRGHADANTLAQILGTQSLGLIPPGN